MYQRTGRTIKKPAQRENEENMQRDKQEQKRKGMVRSNWTNFLKRKALPISVKKRREWSRKRGYHIRQEETKEDKENNIRKKDIVRQSNRRWMKVAREWKSSRVWEKSIS